MNEYAAKAAKIIEKNIYMCLATADLNGIPWNVPVYYAFDEQYNFYWYSRKNTRHSKLIRKNNYVAVAIFNSKQAGEDDGGVYIRGIAHEVKKKDMAKALEVYFSRSENNDRTKMKFYTDHPEDFLAKSVLRMYKMTPEKMYVSNPATKWHEKWIDTRRRVNL